MLQIFMDQRTAQLFHRWYDQSADSEWKKACFKSSNWTSSGIVGEPTVNPASGSTGNQFDVRRVLPSGISRGVKQSSTSAIAENLCGDVIWVELCNWVSSLGTKSNCVYCASSISPSHPLVEAWLGSGELRVSDVGELGKGKASWGEGVMKRALCVANWFVQRSFGVFSEGNWKLTSSSS